MVVGRGEIWWADIPEPRASEPGRRRPVLIVQSDDFNRSRIRTVIAVAMTTNLRLAEAPGNFLLSSSETGLPKDSVANISQIITLDRTFLTERAGQVGVYGMHAVEAGLRTALAL